MNNNDLAMISELFDQKLQPVCQKLDRLEEQFQLRFEGIERRMDSLEKRVITLESKAGVLGHEMGKLGHEYMHTKALLKSSIIPRLPQTGYCYTDIYERCCRTSAEKMAALEADVDILKEIVREHSRKLSRL